MHQQLPMNVYRVDPSGRVEVAVPFEQGKAPNGICFSPDYTKVYVIRGGGISVGDIRGTKVAGLRDFTDCMVDGVRCGPDGMRADRAGNIWCSSAAPLGYAGVTVWNPDGKLIGRIRLPEALRQSLLCRPQARPCLHDRDPVDLHAAGEYARCGAGLRFLHPPLEGGSKIERREIFRGGAKLAQNPSPKFAAANFDPALKGRADPIALTERCRAGSPSAQNKLLGRIP